MSEDTWTASEGVSVDEGFYEARCIQMEDDTGQFGAQIKFTFRIEGGDFDQQELVCWASQYASITPRTKLWGIVDALLGMSPMEVGSIKRTDLIDKVCRIRVEEMAREDGSSFSKVAGFSRLEKRRTPKPKVEMGGTSLNGRLDTLFAEAKLKDEDALIESFTQEGLADYLEASGTGEILLLLDNMDVGIQAKTIRVLNKLVQAAGG